MTLRVNENSRNFRVRLDRIFCRRKQNSSYYPIKNLIMYTKNKPPMGLNGEYTEWRYLGLIKLVKIEAGSGGVT